MSDEAAPKTRRTKTAAEREAISVANKAAWARKRLERTAADAGRAGVGTVEFKPSLEADPVREDMPPAEITRMSLQDRQLSAFDLPANLQKPGWSYMWQVTHVLGQPELRSSMRDAQKAGWRPERAEDWPDRNKGLKPDDPIEEGGLILMGRPVHLTMQAQIEMYNRARDQEKDRMQAVMGGQSARSNDETIGNIRGVRPVGQQLEVELAVGGGPLRG